MGTMEDKQAFKRWMVEVDNEIVGIAGLTHRDIADQTWWDWWDSGMTAREAAVEALEDENFPFPEDFDYP